MTLIRISLDPGAIQPSRATPGSAAFDLHALTGGVLRPGCRILVPTGVRIELPDRHAAWVCSRSGLAHRNGVIVLNSPGLVDSDYRGDVGVTLHNTDRDKTFTWNPGDRIAQLYIPTVPNPQLAVVDQLDDTIRGLGGFGSTGIAA